MCYVTDELTSMRFFFLIWPFKALNVGVSVIEKQEIWDKNHLSFATEACLPNGQFKKIFFKLNSQ